MSNIGATLINTSSGDTVQSEIDSKLPLAGGNLSGKLEIVEDSDIDYLDTSQLTISGPNDTILCFDRLGLFTAGFGVDANNNLVYGGAGSSLGTTHKVWHDGIATKNIAANGYQKLPSGLIIQWATIGLTPSTTNNQPIRVTWPISFPQGILAALTTIDMVGAETNYIPSILNRNLNTCDITYSITNGYASVLGQNVVVAIGI